MAQYLPYLFVLACPVGMGVMMWMMRGNNKNGAAAPGGQSSLEEIAILRAEIAALREQQAGDASRDASGVDRPRP
jgi:hypothetical protein